MKNSVQRFAIAVLVLTMAAAGVMIVQAQQQSSVKGDFRNAQTAEVRDASGTVLLRGTFAPADGDDPQEIERLATLQPTAEGGKMAGEAEVEYQKDAPDTQEIEFQVLSAQPGAVLTLTLDGKEVLKATAAKDGKAEAEALVAVK